MLQFRFCRFLFVMSCLFVVSAHAVPTQDDLTKIERQLEAEKQRQQETRQKVSLLSREIKTLQQEMIRSAQAIQAKEEQLLRLEQNLTALQEKQTTLQSRLLLTDAQLVRVMTGLQTLALRPSELFFLKPVSPVETLRSHLLMKHSIPVIGSINQTLNQDLTELIHTKNSLQNQITQGKTLTKQLTERTSHMNMLLKQKSVLQAQYDVTHAQAKKRAETLASQAKDLKDLLKKLEQEKKRKQAEKQAQAAHQAVQQAHAARSSYLNKGAGAFERSHGSLLYPARGSVVQDFGDITVSGSHVKGMTLATRSNAQVIAPFDGTVLFAGPFKNYGELLIIDNGESYLTLLAGLGVINASVGQELLAGEPIGNMPEKNPRLYIEIRKNGQAINPRSWFIPRN